MIAAVIVTMALNAASMPKHTTQQF